MVVVGDIDPYYRQKQLQNMGNAIANAINFASEAKDKKRAKVRAEFQEALELGKADPEAGLIAMNELENRYKEKLLDNSVPERTAYRGLMAKKVEEGEPMENAWKTFSTSMVERQAEIAELQREVDSIPKVTALDPSTVSQEEYMQRMMRFAQGDAMAMQQANPEYAEKMQILETISNPDLLAQAAYGGLGNIEKIHFQRWLNEEELDMGQLFGMVDKTKLSAKVRGAYAAQTGQLTGQAASAALSEAEEQLSPADKAIQTYNMGRDQIRSTLRMGEIGERGEEARKTERLRQRGTQERLETQSRLGIGVSGKGKGKGGDEEYVTGPSFDEILRGRKDLSAGKYKVDTDVANQLEARAAEFAAASGVSDEDAANTILDIYTEMFDTTKDMEDDLRSGMALDKTLNFGQKKKEEELPPGVSVGAPTIRPPSTGVR